MSDLNTEEQAREERMAAMRGRLSDRGHDPSLVLGLADDGSEVTLAGFYMMLGTVAATEKAGQSPTYRMARMALHAGLPGEVADALYLAYMQQSAEEAGHGDKVFGNAYFAMGGSAPQASASAVGDGSNERLEGFEATDPAVNRKSISEMAAFVGGIETMALKRIFPRVVLRCEQWGHPIANDLKRQIEEIVRPEESRHVLIFRHVFHTLAATGGDQVIDAFHQVTNAGRGQIGGGPLDKAEFERTVGSEAPSLRQMLGKERTAFA